MNNTNKTETSYKYPFDYTTSPYKEMTAKNILSPVIEKTTSNYVNNQPVLIEKVKVDYIKNSVQLNDLFLPDKRQSSYRQDVALQTDIVYNLYDTFGNPLEITTPGNIKIAYKWSSDGQYLLAEVVNASYNEIKDIQTNNLRSQLPNAQVTTYTYKPLAGIESVTDPRGVTAYFKYDVFGRLIEIKDSEGNKVEEYKYNYR
jgi:YD repeat-containing protein